MITPAVMTEPEAAWVREHAWTRTLRKTYGEIPAYFHDCSCQWGLCGACERGRHDRCLHKQYQPFPSSETHITNVKFQVLPLPAGSITHPRRTATGWHIDQSAAVWLADRRCIWSCPCECRADEPAMPQPIVLVSTRTARPAPVGQEALFGVMTS